MSTFQEIKQNEGKTKIIWSTDDANIVRVESKKDITAGDGKKHDLLDGKDVCATTTTCNMFKLLEACGIPTAFKEQDSPTTFLAAACNMITLEQVCRRAAHGSFRERNPHFPKNHYFPRLITETYLKTAGKNWQGHNLACDDPIIRFTETAAELFDPHRPFWAQEKPMLEIPLTQFHAEIARPDEQNVMDNYNRRAFLAAEKAWQLLGFAVVDWKIEFGRTSRRGIVVSDVIDSDSWRKLDQEGRYSDKQIYRDGGDLAKVAAKFNEAAELTSRFAIPRQQIIVWRGSPSDDIRTTITTLEPIKHTSVKITEVVLSGHKNPVDSYAELHKRLQEIPDSIVIAFAGLSNGLGPLLAANCSVPVIAVPATAKEFPDDVWSSLRMPSSVPLMTILKPENAALSALQILAGRNPALYSNLRFVQESRLANCLVL